MTYGTVIVERRDDVGIVTLNRPDKLNAISNRMAWEIGAAVEELDDDPDVCAIVIAGAGRAFCAGADFTRFEAAAEAQGWTTQPTGKASPQRRRRDWIEQVRSSKPIVCAIHGFCLGAGMTRTLPCDARIAATNALFSMRFLKIGIVPEIASTQILAQLVGLSKATDLILSARDVTAAEALVMGIVLKVVEPDVLLDEAIALARTYGCNPPDALVETKKLLYANYVEADIALVARREVEALDRRFGTPENLEAIAAFREKRRPDFRNVSRTPPASSGREPVASSPAGSPRSSPGGTATFHRLPPAASHPR